MKTKKLSIASSVAMLGICGSSLTHAEETFQLTSLTFATTKSAKLNAVTGVGSESESLQTLQFEHFGVNRWGYLYFDLESYNGRHVGAIPVINDGGQAYDLFAIVTPSLSLTKVTGTSFTFGPISDVSLIAMGRQASYYRYKTWGAGVSLNFAVPGFDWFESGVLTHDSSWNVEPQTFATNTGQNYRLDKRRWMWRTLLISKPIDISSQRFNFNFFAIVNSTGNGEVGKHGIEKFVRTELLWQIGGSSDHQLGVRYEYFRHKNSLSNGFGDNSYSSGAPYLMYKYTL
ncbi:hypothetical protein [Methylibium sp.]|uniref:hypothetical protein n=1 Tax=Methylibium sp. TaxID=2067992 RepID=UPI003D0F84C9